MSQQNGQIPAASPHHPLKLAASKAILQSSKRSAFATGPLGAKLVRATVTRSLLSPVLLDLPTPPALHLVPVPQFRSLGGTHFPAQKETRRHSLPSMVVLRQVMLLGCPGAL